MARIFAITSASDALPLAGGRGEISFAVNNTSGRPIRGRARPVALGKTKQEWLSIAGEGERDFSSEWTHEFTVQFAAPAGTAAGKYPFRLDVVSVVNPDEDFTEGPSVTAIIEAAALPTPKAFPWWVIPVVAGVLIVGGLLTWMAMRGDGPDNSNLANTSPTPTPKPTPTPPGTFTGTWVGVNSDQNMEKMNIVQRGDTVLIRLWERNCPSGNENCHGQDFHGIVVGDTASMTIPGKAKSEGVTNFELNLMSNDMLRVIVDLAEGGRAPVHREEFFRKAPANQTATPTPAARLTPTPQQATNLTPIQPQVTTEMTPITPQARRVHPTPTPSP